jgi:hypothetical protein
MMVATIMVMEIMLQTRQVFAHQQNRTSSYTTAIAGIIALASAIKNMGAMTSLNISDNRLGGYYDSGKWVSDMSGVQALAAAIPECK